MGDRKISNAPDAVVDDQTRHAARDEELVLLKPESFIGWINFYAGEFTKYLFGAAVLISVYEVFARYLFNNPTIWAFEATVMLCATGYFISGAYVTQQRRHIGITVLREMAPPKVQYFLEIFSNCVGLFAMSMLFWSGWGPAVRALKRGELAGTPWNPPTPQILKPMIVLAAVLIGLQLLSNLFFLIRDGKNSDEPLKRQLHPER